MQSIAVVWAGAIIANDSKAADGGDDAIVLAPKLDIVGVADGVGSWRAEGVLPVGYARSILQKSVELVRTGKLGLRDLLTQAYRDTESANIPGSTTVDLVRISSSQAKGIHLGDSGVMIIRKNQVVFQTNPLQSRFNYPYQLGAGHQTPADADLWQFTLKKRDWIIVGSDGLFDNLYPKEIVEILETAVNSTNAVDELLRAAYLASKDLKRWSPFAQNKYAATDFSDFDPIEFLGGKPDDISCIVGLVGGSTMSGVKS